MKMSIDFDDPEVQAAVQAKIDEATNGLAAKNSELLGKINESKSKMEEMTGKLKQFENIDIDQVSKMQQYFNENEDAKLIAEGKMEEVINRRANQAINDANSRYESVSQEREELFNQNQMLKQQYDNLVVSQKISDAAVKAGVLPEAIEDVMTRASRTFKVSDGNLEARDVDGNLMVGKKGEPLSASEWVNQLKEVAPHYFPSSQSGGHNYTPSQAESSVLDAAKSGNMAAFRKARQKASGY